MLGYSKYDQLFVDTLRLAKPDSLVRIFDLEMEAQIASLLDISPLQDIFQFRARYLGLKLANLLIDEKGELQTASLSACIRAMGEGFFSLGPNREGDCLIYEHIFNCLQSMPQAWPWIRKFSLPLCHKNAEEIIRETLWPELVRSIETFHVRRALLAAWLTFLRQATGSCFATAPALLIQKTPELFFKDLYDLLSTGQLQRVVGGQQYAVPLCISMGKGDLIRPIRSKEHLGYAPGLIAACNALEMFSPRETPLQKAEKLQQAIDRLEKVQTPQQVLRALSLQVIGLTELDIADEEHLEKMQFEPMLARDGVVFYREPTLRAKKVGEWKKKLHLAELSFLSFNQCALLRVWEYTIASFCDVKTDFAKWNLYTGLGMQIEQSDGVAAFLYQYIDQKLQECNAQISQVHKQYEDAIYKLQSLEALLQRSMSDPKRFEMQGQWSIASREAQMILQERDRLKQRADALAGFFSSLLRHYDAKFQEYFQEVFDPAVSEAEEHLFEDSPAGFRLLYKHGRWDASTWTLIVNEDAYIEALRAFFSAVESEIDLPEGLQREFATEVTTALIQWVQTPEFLSAAMDRAEAAGRRTPWDYVSGGTMQSLLQVYYSRALPLTEKAFLPKSEIELLSGLLSLEKKKDMLMHSPTHAFVLRLDLLPEEALRYAEDNQRFAKQWRMTEEVQEAMGHLFSEKLPVPHRALFIHLFRTKHLAQTPMELRRFFIDAVQGLSFGQDPESLVDAYLYEQTFLLSADDAKKSLRAIFERLPGLPEKKVLQAISQWDGSWIGPSQLHKLAKAIVLRLVQTPFSSIDWDQKIAEEMRQLGICYPHLLLFADTNWSGWFFGFVSNCYSGRLELWRLNRIGMQGFPMHQWRHYFSQENQIPWTVLLQ